MNVVQLLFNREHAKAMYEFEKRNRRQHDCLADDDAILATLFLPAREFLRY